MLGVALACGAVGAEGTMLGIAPACGAAGGERTMLGVPPACGAAGGELRQCGAPGRLCSPPAMVSRPKSSICPSSSCAAADRP